jgi:hypothetical protein
MYPEEHLAKRTEPKRMSFQSEQKIWAYRGVHELP